MFLGAYLLPLASWQAALYWRLSVEVVRVWTSANPGFNQGHKFTLHSKAVKECGAGRVGVFSTVYEDRVEEHLQQTAPVAHFCKHTPVEFLHRLWLLQPFHVYLRVVRFWLSRCVYHAWWRFVSRGNARSYRSYTAVFTACVNRWKSTYSN